MDVLYAGETLDFTAFLHYTSKLPEGLFWRQIESLQHHAAQDLAPETLHTWAKSHGL